MAFLPSCLFGWLYVYVIMVKGKGGVHLGEMSGGMDSERLGKRKQSGEWCNYILIQF